eukprot:96807_1
MHTILKTTILLYCLSLHVCNTDEIRFCSIGMGPFGVFTAKAAIQKGFKMVAAFTRYSKHTETVNKLLEIEDDELSFPVSPMDKLEQIIDETNPHFCIDATNKTIQGIYPHLVRLISKKIHILTLADEAAYPNTRFDLTTQTTYQTLNDLAKQNNVVIIGGGYSDAVLIPVIPSLAASMQSLHKIHLTFQQNIDNRSKSLAKLFGVGLSEKAFKYEFDAIEPRFYVWQRSVVQSIADGINHPILQAKEHNEHNMLQIYISNDCQKCDESNGVYSKLVDKYIVFGDCVGTNTTVIGKTVGNIEIAFSIVYAVTPNTDEFNDIDVKLYGNTNMEFSIKNVDPFFATALPLLYRLPMVLNELKPGFHSVSELPSNKYFSDIK